MRALYQNVNGLNESKFEYFCAKLQQDDYDLIVLAETWFPRGVAYRHHRSFIAESVFTSRDQLTHSASGLLIIGNVKAQKAILVVKKTQYQLTIKYQGLLTAFVYVPPSMKIGTVLDTVDCSILIGDVNIRYSGGGASMENRRKDMQSYMDANQWDRLSEDGTLDHVYSSCPLIHSCITFGPIQTDHVGLEVNIPFLTPLPTVESIWRWSVRDIQKAQKVLWRTWNGAVNDGFNVLLDHIKQGSGFRETRQIVDSLFAVFMDCLDCVFEASLSKYDASQISLCSTKHVVSNYKMGEAHRAYKASLRTRVVNIQGINPAKEAYDHYYSLFSIRHPRFDQDPHIPENQFDDQEINPFDDDGLYDTIQRYPNQKAGGLDGIGPVLLKVLLISSDHV